jgi:hypothetical protein
MYCMNEGYKIKPPRVNVGTDRKVEPDRGE